MKKFLICIIILPILAMAQIISPPDSARYEGTTTSQTNTNTGLSSAAILFQTIERGIQTNAVDEFKEQFDGLVTMIIGGGEHGYYSKNQAASILTAYLSERKLLSFSFSQIHEKSRTPYATGRLVYNHRGIQESTQVYVSLTQKDSQWVITHFNIY